MSFWMPPGLVSQLLLKLLPNPVLEASPSYFFGNTSAHFAYQAVACFIDNPFGKVQAVKTMDRYVLEYLLLYVCARNS